MKTWRLLWIVLFLTVCHKSRSSAITNENIRDAIISVVHMIRSTDDKLARHETRERALGETIKKALATLEKRQRLMEPVKGAVGRLDERLAAVETILLQKDERERIQSQKVLNEIDLIQKNMPGLLERLRNDIFMEISKLTTSVQPPTATPTTEIMQVQLDINNKLTNLANSVSSLEAKLAKIEIDNQQQNGVNQENSKKITQVNKEVVEEKDLIQKLDNKLVQVQNLIQTIPSQSQTANDLMKSTVLQSIETQKLNVEKLLNEVNAITNKIATLPDSEELKSTRNETLDLLQDIKYETIRAADKTATLIDAKLQESAKDSDKKHDVIEKSLIELNEMIDNQIANTADNDEKLRNDIQALRKVENVMMQTADNVMDLKRLVEYSVHQILLEVSDVVKASSKNTSSSINDRFTNFEDSILDSENGALANLTSKIGEDIDQVWRQIGIMYQQLTSSTDTLNKLQNQTDAFVNGSLSRMDSTKAKVGKITERMTEVDDNLNYLLGRLSLVTQEFNNIKKGLGQALDDIKSSFMTVQNKIKGPGPHKVPDEEYEIQTLDDVANNAKSNNSSKRDTT